MTAEQARRLAARIKHRKQRQYPRKLRQAVKAALKEIREEAGKGRRTAIVERKDLPHFPEVAFDDLKYQIERYGYEVSKGRNSDYLLVVSWDGE